MSSTIAVIDFETTGMSPAQGARATEIGIVLLQGGRIVDRFQSLMHSGVRIPPMVIALTGISNAMPAAEVMREALRFVGEAPMVAHNAAFDSKFWQSELTLAGLPASQAFACTVLLSRRIYPEAPSHSLGRLAEHLGLEFTGRAHRALADAEVTAALLARMQQDLCQRHALAACGHALLMQLQRCTRAKSEAWLREQAASFQLELIQNS
ncbi:3'-5' exonuclease [Comamonas composti]|uniref:3'-5' exonuclease n=1 Tax=Comamonas composti TaxID=408558 RepID=UPI000410ED59|nr:3'-5' exonuclease [Comamonas composti]